MPQVPYPSRKGKDIETVYFEVEYEDVFHLKELYKRCYDWFQMWNYVSLDGGEPESLYFEKVTPSGNQEHHIWWRFEKVINNYVKYYIKFDIQTLNSSSVEVMHKGKKAKTNKTDIIFRVRGWVMLDWQDQWENHWLLKHFDRWYVNRWFRDKREAHKKQLWFEVYNLEDMIKQYLQLNTTFDLPETFHPPKGLP